MKVGITLSPMVMRICSAKARFSHVSYNVCNIIANSCESRYECLTKTPYEGESDSKVKEHQLQGMEYRVSCVVVERIRCLD